MTSIVLPSILLPDLRYMSYLPLRDHGISCSIYTGESYVKQSLRNRFYFLSASGRTPFSIPIQKSSYPPPPISSIVISEHGQWRAKLRQALSSAYRTSPYWEHYEESIITAIWYDQSPLLVDYHAQWLQLLCSAWQLTPPDIYHYLQPHDTFVQSLGSDEAYDSSTADQVSSTVQSRYWQVFESRHGFTPGLSSLDLLLNQGPEGRLYLLRESQKLLSIIDKMQKDYRD